MRLVLILAVTLASCGTPASPPDLPADAAPPTDSTLPAAEVVGLRIDAAGPFTAGDRRTFAITAVDENGERQRDYRGTVRVTTSDPNADINSEITFDGGNGGAATVGIMFLRSGEQTIEAVDVADPARHGRGQANVSPTFVTSFDVSDVPERTTAGVPFIAEITARDRFGNLADNFQDPVEISTGSPADLVGADRTWVDGVLRIAVTPIVATEDNLLQVIRPGASGRSRSFSVTHAAPVRFGDSSDPVRARAGVPVDLEVAVTDRFENAASAYRGQARLDTTPSTGAHLVTFTAADAGIAAIPVTFATPGTYTWLVGDGTLAFGRGTVIVDP